MKTIHEFRERLRSFLDAERGRQSSLAKQTGVPQYAISRFLSGKDLPGRYIVPIQHALNDFDEVSCLSPVFPPPSTPTPPENRP